MQISDVAQRLDAQLVRIIYELAKQYDDVIDLTLGDPDIATPSHVSMAGIRAITEGKTKYTANAGIPALRQAICRDVAKRTGVSYTADEVCVTAGAMGALFLGTMSILNEGDEMIILEPHWPNYSGMVKMCHAVPVFVNALDESTLLGDIESAISARTRAIIINSPSNPTGRVLSEQTLEGIARLAKAHDLYVFSDEVYHTIIFGGTYRSIVSYEGMKERCILVDSLSKRFSMTGWRLGFACAPKAVAEKMALLQEHVNSCACMFAQCAGMEALNAGPEAENQIKQVFYERCKALSGELNRCEALSCPMPDGTFYLWMDIRKTGLGSEEFAIRLLKQEHVATVPGNAFNKAGEGYIRIACTQDTSVLLRAAEKIVRFAEGLPH